MSGGRGAVLLRADRLRQLRSARATSRSEEASARDRLKLAKESCGVLVSGMTTECRRRPFPSDLDCLAQLEHVIDRCRQTQRALRERIARERGVRASIREESRRLRTPGQRRAQERKEESDGLAQYDVPEELHGLWRRERKRFPYSLPADRRALSFLEWAEKHPDAVRDYMVERWDRMERDAEKRSRERDHEVEGVPF